MSITREEAIKELERFLSHWDDLENGKRSFRWYSKDAVGLAITALRPVSREQVERIWFREPYTRLETKCGENGDIVYSAVNTCMACGHETPIGNFCHNCGAAQTREAVEMVMERWKEALDGETELIVLLQKYVEEDISTQEGWCLGMSDNKALTLEELLRMDGAAPVWLDVAGGMWALVDALDGCLWLDRGGSIDIAKFAGKAYRRPPEGEEREA